MLSKKPENGIDKNSPLYQKYLRKYDADAPENIAKRKQEKRDRARKWLSQNRIPLLSLIIAILALIIAARSLDIARLTYEAEYGTVEEVAQSKSYGK